MQAITIMNDNNTSDYPYANRFLKVLTHIVNETHFNYLGDLGLTLTVEQLEVLSFIHSNPGASLQNIIENSDLNDIVVTDAVTELGHSNLIQSQFDDDTQIPVYYMSMGGITIMRDLQNNQHRSVVDLLSELSLNEQVVVIQMLERALLSYNTFGL